MISLQCVDEAKLPFELIGRRRVDVCIDIAKNKAEKPVQIINMVQNYLTTAAEWSHQLV